MAAKAYRQFAFVLPWSVLSRRIRSCAPLASFSRIPGLQPGADRAGYQFLMILIVELSVTLGQMVALITPNSFISSLLNPFFIIVFALFCGVTIAKPQIPGFWRSWLYQLDPLTWAGRRHGRRGAATAARCELTLGAE